MNVNKYKANSNFVLGSKLFLKDDIIYMQVPGGVSSLENLCVFDGDRNLVSTIHSDKFYDLEKKLTLQTI